MQIVNGYVCQTGCDVAAAKKGHDPRNPHDDPVKAAALAEQAGLASGKALEGTAADARFAVEAVQFGGRLAGLSVPRGAAPAVGLVDRVA